MTDILPSPDRAYGIPLESVSAAQWRAVVPDVVSALEAMRTTDLSATTGFGGWGADGQAPCATWTEFLLAVGDDPPEHRTYGWRKRLATVPEGEAAFAWGIERLKQVATDAIPRCLTHCDLMNRNVLVQADQITAVFDWGCSLYGDHLYDLAWFEFWAPWTPELDIQLLKTALAQRWQEAGYAPENLDARLMACNLRIGLDHLAYNAYLGDWSTLTATAERMRTLVSGAIPCRHR